MWHRMCNPLLIPSGLLGIPDTLFFVSVPLNYPHSTCEVKDTLYPLARILTYPSGYVRPHYVRVRNPSLTSWSRWGLWLAHKDLGGHDVPAGLVVRCEGVRARGRPFLGAVVGLGGGDQGRLRGAPGGVRRPRRSGVGRLRFGGGGVMWVVVELDKWEPHLPKQVSRVFGPYADMQDAVAAEISFVARRADRTRWEYVTQFLREEIA